jgi:hypothetical protein
VNLLDYSIRNERGKVLRERSATCKTCGLTARNQSELDNHINHAHRVTAGMLALPHLRQHFLTLQVFLRDGF